MLSKLNLEPKLPAPAIFFGGITVLVVVLFKLLSARLGGGGNGLDTRPGGGTGGAGLICPFGPLMLVLDSARVGLVFGGGGAFRRANVEVSDEVVNVDCWLVSGWRGGIGLFWRGGRWR